MLTSFKMPVFDLRQRTDSSFASRLWLRA